MLKNVSDITSEGKQTGLNTQDNILAIDKSQSPDMMNVVVHFDGSLEKRLGSNTQNSVVIANSAAAGFSPTGSITSNIIAFWKLDEASGTRSDAIGGHTLTDGNGVLQSAGIKNQAALFAAANSQYLLHINTSTLATGDVSFSMSSWFYMNSTSTTAERTIIAKTNNEGPLSRTIVSYETGQDGFLEIGNLGGGGVARGAQSIILDANATVGGAAVFIRPNANAPGQGELTLRIETNSSGLPSGSLVNANATGTIAEASVPADYAFVNVKFANTFNLTAGDTNWLVLQRTTETGNDQIYNWGKDTTNPTFTNGVAAQYFAAWAGVQAGTDALFKLLGPTTSGNYEYWLFVNTDNVLTFRVSSSGSQENITVRATSFGAVTTSTWYNAVAYHDAANDLVAVGINLSMNSSAYASGVKSGSAPFVLGAVSNGAAAFFDGRIDETGFWKKVLNTTDRANLYNGGSGNTYQASFNTLPWASFDFGASSIRWLTVAAGTGIYASSNLGVTWVNIATDRTATYQYFERSKNVLIATSDLYDTPLYWTGSSNTFMAVVNSNAPLCKYSINFQGFLILLNSQSRKRGFFYQDENTQLTGTWASSFDIPSSADDEITAAFIFRKNLYVSTRYYLYRVSYVGGNPDFSYEKVKDWGYIARTVKQIYVDGVGQVVKGLCWDGKTRLFDGSDDQISSNNIEQDNELCEFALDNLSFSGSGPLISFAETDYNENVYKLCVAIGVNSTQTTHMINYDGRSKAWYPFDRQHFNTMVMAESANKRFLMAFDRSGYCHMLNSGNLDGNTTSINDHYDSSLIFEKSPAQSQKGHVTNLFFSNATCGRLYVYDKTDFDNDYKLRESFVISGSDRKFHIHKVIDVPESYNVYQWRLTSSSGTSDPWKLQRYDHMLKGQGIGKE